jgi:hypothetical protein
MLSAIIGMLSAINRNHCPQSIGTPVRNRRNPHTKESNGGKVHRIPPAKGCVIKRQTLEVDENASFATYGWARLDTH